MPARRRLSFNGNGKKKKSQRGPCLGMKPGAFATISISKHVVRVNRSAGSVNPPCSWDSAGGHRSALGPLLLAAAACHVRRHFPVIRGYPSVWAGSAPPALRVAALSQAGLPLNTAAMGSPFPAPFPPPPPASSAIVSATGSDCTAPAWA